MPRKFTSPFKETRGASRRNTRPSAFVKELKIQLIRHGDITNVAQIYRKCTGTKSTSTNAINRWLNLDCIPRAPSSFHLLNKLEEEYGLPKDYFRAILYPQTPTECAVKSARPGEQHYVRWHLPADFDRRGAPERHEVVSWIRSNILACGTEFGRYVSKCKRERFAIALPALFDVPPQEHLIWNPSFIRAPRARLAKISRTDAPTQLIQELEDYVRYKRLPLSPINLRRNRAWSKSAAFISTRRISRALGSLSAPTGLGVNVSCLTIAIFVMPAFWDWYLQSQGLKRGFYTQLETSVLVDAMGLLKETSGWLRQNCQLKARLRPIPGLISKGDIISVTADWVTACNNCMAHLRRRFAELKPLVQMHRDPFAAIAVVLESDAPLREYRKIAEEILLSMPDATNHPIAAAQHVRSYLLIRLAMLLGLRQRNLRQLLVCQKGQIPSDDRSLKMSRRGELRWSDNCQTWEVYIPSEAFKNWRSHFFRKTPYRMLLKDVSDLHYWIEEYLRRHRPALLGNYSDPRTFFVQTGGLGSNTIELNCSSFGRLWRDTIILFGIYNPFTKRGAIQGLLPHRPHAIRDVIATHIVKQTHSAELAAYSLHSTPRVVERHYCKIAADRKIFAAGSMLENIWE